MCDTISSLDLYVSHSAKQRSAPLWYYYMAIVATCVRVTGGLVVAFFKYMGDKSLYQLLVTDGTVEVLRGGELMTMDQTDVVPGDIIRLVVSQ